MADGDVQPHNIKPAANWGASGRVYEKFSEHFGDAIIHCIDRLAPRPGETVLDVATGTGWGARNAARRGAQVHGVDFAAGLIEAAGQLAAEAGLEMEFSVGDAENLRFEDASFDVVMSTFGVMFARDQEAAAQELARVCKPGGRLGLTTWPPEGTVAGLTRDVLVNYRPPPPDPPPPSQFAWGREERVRELLAPHFDLHFETGCSMLRVPDGEVIWDIFSQSQGLTIALLKTLSPERQAQFRADVIAYHEPYRDALGIAMPRDYLVTIGVRK